MIQITLSIRPLTILIRLFCTIWKSARIRVLLALLACSWIIACDYALSEAQTRSKQRGKALAAMAEQAFSEGRFRQAVSIYRRATKIDPGNSEHLLGRGMAYEMSGHLKKAVEDSRAALRIDRNNYMAMENLAGIYERRGDNTDKAIALYRRAFDLDPRPEWKENLTVWMAILKTRLRPRTSSAVDLWNLGNEQASEGKFKAAHESYSRAMVLDPLLFQAHFSRGLLLLDQGQTAAAVEDFDEALEISPLLPGGLVARGLALEKLGKLREAESDFEEAARQHPRDWEGWYHLSRMLEQRKKLRFAVAGYEKVLELKSKPEIRRELKKRLPRLRSRLPNRGTGVRVLVHPFRDRW